MRQRGHVEGTWTGLPPSKPLEGSGGRLRLLWQVYDAFVVEQVRHDGPSRPLPPSGVVRFVVFAVVLFVFSWFLAFWVLFLSVIFVSLR